MHEEQRGRSLFLEGTATIDEWFLLFHCCHMCITSVPSIVYLACVKEEYKQTAAIK